MVPFYEKKLLSELQNKIISHRLRNRVDLSLLKHIESLKNEHTDRQTTLPSHGQRDIADVNGSEPSSVEDLDFYDDDDSLNDYETIDYVQVPAGELRNNISNDCGACSKVFTIGNRYKCKKCGTAVHRSNCNKWFNTVKKHYYCGGCVYEFKPQETVSLERPMCAL